ncbi:MAG: sigma-70 family RNA polymerase sigma factor [candidate division Zixibacteria bacterium]|nr:sigma-70 family RNA polymerase sigma factor [candidate division Zixibacteria bacterium]
MKKNINQQSLKINSPLVEEDESEVKQLIVRIKDGDKAAFSELVRRYRNQVASLAYKVVNDYDEAADVTQIVFIKMFKNIWRYDDRKKFYTWLYRITINASIDYVRKHHRYRMESIDNLADSFENIKSDPETAYRRQQISDYIKRAAHTLNDKQLSAFTLRDIEGCKVDDVADIMNMPVATVRWYLHRARTKIRKELTRNCPHLLLMMGIK